jgi:alanyl-tRNA synthetase
MQYEQVSKDKRVNLPKPSVDTGMGLERISALLQGTHDNYQTDHFKKLINSASEILKVKFVKIIWLVLELLPIIFVLVHF